MNAPKRRYIGTWRNDATGEERDILLAIAEAERCDEQTG